MIPWGGSCIQPTQTGQLYTRLRPHVDTADPRTSYQTWKLPGQILQQRMKYRMNVLSIRYLFPKLCGKRKTTITYGIWPNKPGGFFLLLLENCWGGGVKTQSMMLYLLLLTTTASTVTVTPVARPVTVSAAEVPRRRPISLPVVRVRVEISPAPLVGAPSRSFGWRLVLLATTRFIL